MQASFRPLPGSKYAGRSDSADLLGAEAQEGPVYRYDRCRGKPAGALCPERDPLALFLILGVPVGLQMWCLHVGPLLG